MYPEWNFPSYLRAKNKKSVKTFFNDVIKKKKLWGIRTDLCTFIGILHRVYYRK